MPIHTMNYDAGVFFAKQVGYIDDVDAKMWHNALNKYAKTHDSMIVAVIDMREVERLVPTVTSILSKALSTPNLTGIAVIISEAMSSRNARVLSALNELKGVRVFSSLEDGQTFARMRLNPSGGFVGMAQFSYAYACASPTVF